MFKFVLLVTLCGIMLAESKPSSNVEVKLADNNYRVVRSAQYVQNAMKLAEQVANQGLQAAKEGAKILTTGAEQTVKAASSIAGQMANSAISMI